MIAVEFFDNFNRELKRLSKKFRTLPDEVGELINEIEEDPKKGTDLGGGFYKIRLASESKSGGKSGGLRAVRRCGNNILCRRNKRSNNGLFDNHLRQIGGRFNLKKKLIKTY